MIPCFPLVILPMLATGLLGDEVQVSYDSVGTLGAAIGATPGPTGSSTGAEPQDGHGDPLPLGGIARLGSQRWRHGGRITAIEFSPDGRLLACIGDLHSSCEGDRSIRLLDAKTGKLMHRLDETPGLSHAVAFSPSGKRLVSCVHTTVWVDGEIGVQGSVRLWNTETGAVVWKHAWQHAVPAERFFGDEKKGEIWTVAPPSYARFFSDGKQILVSSLKETFRVLDAETGRQLKERLFWPASATYAPTRDGHSLVSTLPRQVIRFEDPVTGDPQKEYRLKTADVLLTHPSQFRPKWERDPQTGAIRRANLGKVPDNLVHKLWVSPNGRIVLLKTQDRTVSVDLEAGDILADFTSRNGRAEAWADCLGFSPDGNLAVLKWKKLQQRHAEYNMRVVDVRAGKTLAEFIVPDKEMGRGPICGAFAPDGKRVAVAVKNYIRVWEFREQERPPAVEGHWDRITAITFSPDSTRIATATGRDETVRLWSARTGEQLHEWPIERHWLSRRAVAFSPNGKVLAIDRDTKTVDLVDCTTGQRIHSLTAVIPEGRSLARLDISYVAFFPDGKRLVWLMPETRAITIWDVESGKLLRGHVPQVADTDDPGRSGQSTFEYGGDTFSPSRRLTAFGSFYDRVLYVVETETGKKLLKRDVPSGLATLCFSPNEKKLAVGLQSGKCLVIDLANGQVLRTLTGPDFQPTPRVGHEPRRGAFPRAFLGGGRVLATHHFDRTTRFWDLTTGQEIDRLDGHRLETFSAGGRFAVSVSETDTALVWDVLRWRQLRGRYRPADSGPDGSHTAP